MTRRADRPSMGPDTTVAVSGRHLSADLGEEVALLHTGTGMLFGLNETAAHVWRLLDRPRLIREVHRRLWAEYDVEPGRCWTELVEVLEMLAAEGFVDVHPGP